jgi:hypothetical protein
MVRVTGHASGGLAGDEKLGKFGVTLVKFNIVGGEPAYEVKGFFVIFELVTGKADEQLDVASFGD